MRVVFPLIMRAPPVDPRTARVPKSFQQHRGPGLWTPGGLPAQRERGRGDGSHGRPCTDRQDRAPPGGSAITRRNMAKRVGVVGGGIMGSGIAEVSARAGYDVVVREVDDAAAE